MLSFGCSGSRRHTREELEFLETAAQKLGIAVENLRLLEQVLRSQRQWMNTFDSIQDLILAHDADFRILKTNQALLQRLEQAPADVLGNLCEEVLPQKHAWSGCPYCERGSGLTEGHGSVFRRPVGGFDFIVCGAGKPAEGHHPRGARYDRASSGGRKVPHAV